MQINTSGLGRPSALAEKRYSASRLSNIQVKKCAGAEYGGHEDIGSSSISYFNQF